MFRTDMKKIIAICVLAAFAFVPALRADDQAPSKDNQAPAAEKAKDSCPASKGCCDKSKEAKKECPMGKDQKCPAEAK